MKHIRELIKSEVNPIHERLKIFNFMGDEIIECKYFKSHKYHGSMC